MLSLGDVMISVIIGGYIFPSVPIIFFFAKIKWIKNDNYNFYCPF